MSMGAGSGWIEAGIAILDKIQKTQSESIERASQICAEAIGDGGLVHLFGTGHSPTPVEEMFPRYGSYPGFHPVVELSMTIHTQVVGANGQRQAMFIERTPGLAEVILSNFKFAPKDALIAFSASGLGAVVGEMARGARAGGGPPPLGCPSGGRGRWMSGWAPASPRKRTWSSTSAHRWATRCAA